MELSGRPARHLEPHVQGRQGARGGTLSGALEAGVVTTSTVIDTGHGPAHLYGRPLRDHFDGPGRPFDFIRKSSNKGTAMIAQGIAY